MQNRNPNNYCIICFLTKLTTKKPFFDRELCSKFLKEALLFLLLLAWWKNSLKMLHMEQKVFARTKNVSVWNNKCAREQKTFLYDIMKFINTQCAIFWHIIVLHYRMVSYGHVWPCVALHLFFLRYLDGRIWFFCAIILHFLAVIDPNSFGLFTFGKDPMRCATCIVTLFDLKSEKNKYSFWFSNLCSKIVKRKQFLR